MYVTISSHPEVADSLTQVALVLRGEPGDKGYSDVTGSETADSVGKLRNFEDPGARLKGLVSAQDAAGQLAWKLVARSVVA